MGVINPNTTSCGGVLLDNSIFKVVDGVISVIGEVSPITEITSVCGQPFDAHVFAVGKNIEGKDVLTSNTAPDGVVMHTVRSNCGFLGDARYFSSVDNTLSFQEGFILTVNVAPFDAEPTIVVKQGLDVIQPLIGTTNQFLMTVIDGVYDVSVSAIGYYTKTQQIINTENEVINIALSDLLSIAITTPPTKIEYTEGEMFDDSGMIVTATFSDSTTLDVTDYDFIPNKGLTIEDTKVTIMYQGKSTEQNIVVS